MVAAPNPIEIGTMPKAPGVPRSQTVVSTGDTLRWVLVFAGATMVLTAILLAMLADGQARARVVSLIVPRLGNAVVGTSRDQEHGQQWNGQAETETTVV